MPRATGTLLPGSLASWFAAAKVGDIYWTDRAMNGLISQAARVGRRITLKRYLAVNDDLQAVRLVRIEVTE